jgi:hypothetical protein
MSTSQYVARFHFAKRGTPIGKPFEGVIKICEHAVRFRGAPITFWHRFAQITHKEADRHFLIDNSADPETFIFVQRNDGRHGRGICVATEIAGTDFNIAIAGAEAFSPGPRGSIL